MKWIIPENSLRLARTSKSYQLSSTFGEMTAVPSWSLDLVAWTNTYTRPTDTTVGWWVLAACFLWKSLPDTNWNSWVFGCESQSATSWSFSCFLGIIITLEPAQLYGLLYMYPYGLGLWVTAWVWLGYATYIQLLFQDPKLEVLYHIRPYFGDISPYIGLT